MTSSTHHDPLRRAVALLDIPWRRTVASVLAGAGGLGSAVALAAVSAWLIARASQMPPVMHLGVAAVAVRTFGISRGLLRYVERLLSHDLALHGMARLREQVYRRLAAGSTVPLVALRRGDLLARVGADVDAVGDVVVRGLLPAAVAAVVGLGSVALLGAFLPVAGAWLAACLLVAGLLAPVLATRAVRTAEEQGAAARTETTAVALTMLDGAAEIAVGGRAPALLTALASAEEDSSRATEAGARTAAPAAAVTPLATGLAVLGCLVLGAPALASGALEAVELAVVVLTPLAAFEAIALLPAAGVQALRSREAARRIMALLDAADEGDHGPGAPAGARPTPRTDSSAPPPRASSSEPEGVGAPDRDGPTLTARGLSCGWPGRPPTLTDVDLDLHPGRSVAVVGPSGTGKTTLLLTLAGLLPPAAGSVEVDGVPPAGRPRDEVAARVAMTAEDAHVFDTTVLENLRVARGDVTEDEARDALRAVGLGAWLAALPLGLQTVLGSDGRHLSGGERRRVLVARALLCPAPLLLLDEPTEHLDEDGTALLRGLLDGSVAPGRGILVVTHRLTGLEAAGEVILVDRTGSVRARGTHAQLLASPEADGYRAGWFAEAAAGTRRPDDHQPFPP